MKQTHAKSARFQVPKNGTSVALICGCLCLSWFDWILARVKCDGLMLMSWECHSSGRLAGRWDQPKVGEDPPAGPRKSMARPRKSEARSRILETRLLSEIIMKTQTRDNVLGIKQRSRKTHHQDKAKEIWGKVKDIGDQAMLCYYSMIGRLSEMIMRAQI